MIYEAMSFSSPFLFNIAAVFLFRQMKSKLKFSGYLWAAFSAIVAVSLICLFFESISEFSDSPFLFFIKCLFFLFMWLVIFFSEVKTKIISVEIESRELFVKRYLGLGITHFYNVDQINGFKTSILKSRNNKSYEYLYLMIDNRRVAIVSEYYHSNYKDLKNCIVANGIKCIGPGDDDVVQRIKDIFSR